jgi:hypothetical protein
MTTYRLIIPAADRVRRRLVRDGDCLVWTGATFRYGYGNIRVRKDGRWRNQGTHVVIWEEAHGPLPEGQIVRHTCDNPPCCNLSHLAAGTQADNLNDAVQRGRLDRAANARRQIKHRDSATGRFTSRGD